MKTRAQKPGVAEKKPPTTAVPVLTAGGSSASMGIGSTALPSQTFESPSAAVWSKYIDSRMKQFETR